MIREPTVLVLGAGASAPFGFPQGFGLLQMVVGAGDHRRAGRRVSEVVTRAAGSVFEGFREALRNSGKMSVDSFLEHRSDYMDVGKKAIAAALLPAEDVSRLTGRSAPSWYEFLFNSTNATPSEFGKNDLSIITFNYDRSLEFFIHTALMNSYDLSAEDATSLLLSIPIVHVHGDLGGLPGLTSEDCIPYGTTEPDSTQILTASRRINVLHETEKTSPLFAEAQESLQNARRVLFLGLGFGRTNLERLGCPWILEGKTVVGTAFGLTRPERELARIKLGKDAVLEDLDCLGLLRSVPSFFEG